MYGRSVQQFQKKMQAQQFGAYFAQNQFNQRSYGQFYNQQNPQPFGYGYQQQQYGNGMNNMQQQQFGMDFNNGNNNGMPIANDVPDLDTITHGRLLLEKNFYLNQSNSKYITVGIKPATKFLNKDNTGFYVDVLISGKNIKPVSLGGVDGFMNLCQSLRSFEELKYTYPLSCANYDEIESQFPINISKKPYNGMVCFNIETMGGGYAIMAQNTCSEMLKHENLIVISIRRMHSIVGDIEAKFNELVKNCGIDFTTAVKDIAKSTDTLSVDIYTNFNDLLKFSVDQYTRFNSAPPTPAVTPAKRKRATVAAGTKRSKAKKTDTDHSYAAPIDSPPVGNSTQETGKKPVESESGDSTPQLDGESDSGSDDSERVNDDSERVPIGLIESGQRFESEHYI